MTNAQRDPRIDPQPGDALLCDDTISLTVVKTAWLEVLYEFRPNGALAYLPMMCRCTKKQWRITAKDATVVTIARERG